MALTPGPAVLCAMSHASRHGVRSSLAGIAGIQTGNLLFFLCVAFGLGTLLATATTAFTMLRILGAIYLFYLGLNIILGTLRRKRGAEVEKASPPARHRNLFLQGLLIQVTNPKALLFVSALLPQFIQPSKPVALQSAILAVVTIVIDSVVLSGYAAFAARTVSSFRRSRVTEWLERAFGTALLLFGVRLLVSKK